MAARRGVRFGGLQASEPEPRFWAKVQIGGMFECWDWTAVRDGHGYGKFRDVAGEGGYPEHAHRIAYRYATGQPTPAGLVVMHTCDNRLCCNPAHLRLATQTENIADRDRKGRTFRGKRPPKVAA